MSAAWHRRDSNLLARLKDELGQRYPDLYLTVEQEWVILRGTFPVTHHGVELDRFRIKVVIPPDFPRSIPVVFETGDRVPQSADWHTYERGTLCVVVPEEWLLNPASESVIAFLDGPVRNFLISHSLAEQGVERPMGERPHGSKGLLEAYGELVGQKDHAAIETTLKFLAKERVKGHWDCHCGSGKRLRICHMLELIELRKKIPSWIAAKALKRLHDQRDRERANREARK